MIIIQISLKNGTENLRATQSDYSRSKNRSGGSSMKKFAIIGGLSLMTAGTTNMLWHKQKLDLNPNTFAIATGGFFVAVGITYRF